MKRSFAFPAKIITLLTISCLGLPIAGKSQRSDPAPEPPAATRSTAKDSVDDLAAEVQELRAALADVRAELLVSRREAKELHEAIDATGKDLASFRRELAEKHRETANIVAAPSSEISPQVDSFQSSEPTLDERLKKLRDDVAVLDESQQLLSAKVTDEYQTKVDSGSKYRVRLSGLVLLNLFGARGSVDNLDLPNIANAKGTLDSSGTFGATLRQSLLSLEVFGPRIGGAKTSGDVQFDFFGGFPVRDNGVTSGLVRLRTARISLDWQHTSIVAGQDVPFFSPLSPTSLASTATPAFSYSGNMWTWTPQIRIERRLILSENSNLLIQGGILDTLTGESPQNEYYRLPSAGEKSGQPTYAARFAWNGIVWGLPLTLGSGSFYARQNLGFGRTIGAWAATVDWQLPLGHWVSLSGEFYRGRALGGFGGGASGRVLFSGPPDIASSSLLALGSAGGWSQLKFTPMDKLEFNGAFGEDYPFHFDVDRFSFPSYSEEPPLGRNATAFVNFIYHARSNLLFSVEYRRLWSTDLVGPRQTADHVDASAGILF